MSEDEGGTKGGASIGPWEIAGFGVLLYVLIVLSSFRDAAFLLNGPALRLNVGLEAPAGSISLPAVGVDVSILRFFALAPVIAIAVHTLLLHRLRQRLLAGEIAPNVMTILVPLAAFAGPVTLLALQNSYAPFAAIRPEESWSAAWLSLVHCAAISVAGIATPAMLFPATMPICPML